MGTPIKILHVVHSLEPGGLENGVINLSRTLDPSEFETHVFCLQNAGKFSERLGEPLNIYPHGKGSGFSGRAVWALNQRIRGLNPQIVHSHNLGPLIYSGLATAMGRLKPLLHGEHSQLAETEQTPRRMRQRRWFYRACKRIHTVSDSLTLHLIELGFPRAKIVSIPNGVDTERFAPSPQIRETMRRALGVPASAQIIGIVGRFGEHKRHSLLIEACTNLAARMPDLHLLVVGAGGPQEAAALSQIKESVAAKRIHWLGFQNRTEDYYRCMDLLVVPSINEGLSNAVLEGMACGVAALSHLACGSAEAITHGKDGYLADLSSADLLQEQIAAIFETCGALAEMGSRARAKVVSQFSLVAMTEGYSRLYRETAEGARNNPRSP